MVVDTSAWIAVLQRESDADACLQAIEGDPVRLFSTVSALEAAIVTAGRLGPEGEAQLELLIFRLDLEMVPFDKPQLEFARLAFRQFGKGRHPAGLNFGDCAAYALAKATGEPLLFAGEDFSKTDIPRAVPWK